MIGWCNIIPKKLKKFDIWLKPKAQLIKRNQIK